MFNVGPTKVGSTKQLNGDCKCVKTKFANLHINYHAAYLLNSVRMSIHCHWITTLSSLIGLH